MPRVIFIPGLPGSKLRVRRNDGTSTKVWLPRIGQMVPSLDPTVMRRLRAPDDLSTDDGVFAGRPIRTAARFLGFDLMKQAGSLYEILGDLGCGPGDLLKLGWDWRRPVTDDALAPGPGEAPGSARLALSRLLEAQVEKVTLIVHSTGGLLMRHCLEQEPGLAAKVERVIAFGVPWGGTLKSLAALVGQQGFGTISPAEAQIVFASSWAAFDLLPRAAGTGLVTDPSGQEVNLLAETAWTSEIPNDAQGALGAAMRLRAAHSLAVLGTPGPEWTLPIDVVNVAGWGKKTIVRAELGADDTIDLDPPDLDNESGHDAEDGCAATDERIFQGDGTVPFASASWLKGDRVTSFHVPIGALKQVTMSNQRHSALWRNPGARALLAHHLAGRPFEAFAYAAVDWSHKVDPGAERVRTRYVMQAPDGSPLPGASPRVRTSTGWVPGSLEADGRGLFDLARESFPKTPTGRFRRVTVELPWSGDPDPEQQSMFIEP